DCSARAARRTRRARRPGSRARGGLPGAPAACRGRLRARRRSRLDRDRFPRRPRTRTYPGTRATSLSTATTAPARRLIVTGDDFGLAAEVNRGILRAHRDGILTTTSLMV